MTDIRGKARAIEVYARQAQNTDAEKKAYEIRLRAERRARQLLAEGEKAKGAAEPGTNRGTTRYADNTASEQSESKPKTLAELEISKVQSSEWQQLAAVSDESFEEHLATDEYEAVEERGDVTIKAQTGHDLCQHLNML